MTARIETFRYDVDIVRKFVCATLLWGAVATALGLWIAVLLVAPKQTTAGFAPVVTKFHIGWEYPFDEPRSRDRLEIRGFGRNSVLWREGQAAERILVEKGGDVDTLARLDPLDRRELEESVLGPSG